LESDAGALRSFLTHDLDILGEGSLGILGGILPTKCNNQDSPEFATNVPVATVVPSPPSAFLSQAIESTVAHTLHSSVFSMDRRENNNSLASSSRVAIHEPTVGLLGPRDDDLAFEKEPIPTSIQERLLTQEKKPIFPRYHPDRPLPTNSHTSSDLSPLFRSSHLHFDSSASAMVAFNETTQDDIHAKKALAKDENSSAISGPGPQHITDSENSITTDDTDIDDLTSEITDYSLEPERSKNMPPVLQLLGNLSTWNVMVALSLILRSDQSEKHFGALSYPPPVSQANVELQLSAVSRGSVTTRSGESSSPSNRENTQSDHAIGNPNSSNGKTNGNSKRSFGSNASQPHHDNDKQDNSDDEDDGSKKRPRLSSRFSPPTRPGAKKKFACPFFKRVPKDHQRWRSCAGPGWDTVHRVKYV
jgi:hypothetical protein